MLIDVHAIETVVFDELDSTRDERRTCGRVGDEVEVTVLRIRPTTDRKQDFQVSWYDL